MLIEQLEKLKHFVGVANAASIRKYALENGLSQPAVSKSLSKLEAALDAPLLNRDREGVTLTRNGSVLYEFAEEILARTRETELIIQANEHIKINGEVKLGAYSSIGVYFLPKFYDFLLQSQPDLKLSIVTAPSASLIKELRAGRVDCVVSIQPPQIAELHHIKLYTDTYSLYRRSGIDVDPAKSPIFTLPSATDCELKTVGEYLHEAGLAKQLAACSDFETVKAMVENGVGVAILPDRVAESLVRAQKITPILRERKLMHFGPHDIVFSCKRHRKNSPSLRWLADQLLSMLKR